MGCAHRSRPSPGGHSPTLHVRSQWPYGTVVYAAPRHPVSMKMRGRVLVILSRRGGGPRTPEAVRSLGPRARGTVWTRTSPRTRSCRPPTAGASTWSRLPPTATSSEPASRTGTDPDWLVPGRSDSAPACAHLPGVRAPPVSTPLKLGGAMPARLTGGEGGSCRAVRPIPARDFRSRLLEAHTGPSRFSPVTYCSAGQARQAHVGVPEVDDLLLPEVLLVGIPAAAVQPDAEEQGDGEHRQPGVAPQLHVVVEHPGPEGRARCPRLDLDVDQRHQVGRAGAGQRRMGPQLQPGDQVELALLALRRRRNSSLSSQSISANSNRAAQVGKKPVKKASKNSLSKTLSAGRDPDRWAAA